MLDFPAVAAVWGAAAGVNLAGLDALPLAGGVILA